MSQAKTGELENYVRRIGENIVNIYTKFNELNRKIKEIEGTLDEVKADLANHASSVSDIKENFVQKQEFEESINQSIDRFISILNEGMKELIPQVPTETEEAKTEEAPEVIS